MENKTYAQIVNGRELSRELVSVVKNQVEALNFKPIFCDIWVGEDPVSGSYVKIKGRQAQKGGMEFRLEKLSSNITQAELFEVIKNLNNLPRLAGLILQLPLPSQLKPHTQQFLDAIRPDLDVDCLGEANKTAFYEGKGKFAPPTALAVVKILDSLKGSLSGKRVVVVGQGNLVGKPVTYLLKQRGIRVETANSKTEDLKALTLSGDILVLAAGRPGMLKGEMVKEGAVVIDAGTSESEGGIVGDADFETVSKKASVLSPVPGGVGPVTVAALMENVLLSAKYIEKNEH